MKELDQSALQERLFVSTKGHLTFVWEKAAWTIQKDR